MQCTARKRNGDRCGSKAVTGATVCRMHGGSAPQVRAAAARRLEQAEADRQVRLWGGRRDIHPAEALLELVGSKAAEVAYWEGRVSELEHDHLVWGKTKEKTGGDDHGVTFEARINTALDQLHICQRDLASFSAASLKAGVDEEHLKLRRSQAEQVVKLVQAALTTAGVDADRQHQIILDTVRSMGQED